MSDEKLTDREEKFAMHKALGKTHADAVRDAGYKPSTDDSAKNMGTIISKRPRVQNRIEELRRAESKKIMEAMPALIKSMIDLAKQEDNLRIKFEATRDLLDRIPGLGKKEKIQISEEDFPAEVLRLLNRLNIDEGEA